MLRTKKSKPLDPKIQKVRDVFAMTLNRLGQVTDPSLDAEMLGQYRATVHSLDFDSGRPLDRKQPVLLELMNLSKLEGCIDLVRPWELCDGSFYNYEPRAEDTRPPSDCHIRDASSFVHSLQAYLDHKADEIPGGTVLEMTAWRMAQPVKAERWLGRRVDDVYIWDCACVYQPLQAPPPGGGFARPERTKPHLVCQVVDSTPFKDGHIRTSELKTIALMAFVNYARIEYNHLGCFGVTVISCWSTDVRIVQGFVNLNTAEITLFVSEPQSFRNGIRLEDGSLDPRYLTVLAYHLGKVLPLPEC